MYDLLKKVMNKPRIHLLKKRKFKKKLMKIKMIKLFQELSGVLRDIGGFTIPRTTLHKIMILKY